MRIETTAERRRPNSQARRSSLTVSRTRAARVLVGAVVLLQALNIPAIVVRFLWDVPGSTGYNAFFGVSGEGKVPTFYSGVTLLAAALLLAAIAAHERDTGGRFTRQWAGLSLIFVFMAADELLEIHELTIRPVRRAFGITGGPLYFAWVVPATALIGLLGIAYARFLQALPGASLRSFVIAGIVYVGGALGMELVSGAYVSARGEDLVYGVMAAVEELGEMTGVALFIVALLDHLGRIAPDWQIRLRR